MDGPAASPRAIALAMFLCAIIPVTLSSAEPPFAAGRPAPIEVDQSRDEFCIVVVPDTQRYTAFFPDIFRAQFTWIRSAVGPLNMKYVIHVGDIVEEETEAEWALAAEMFMLIDGVVPFLAVPGNHDMDKASYAKSIRATTRYNGLFSPQRFTGRPWYGGSRGVTGDNSFGYFTAGGQEYMVLGLEYGPSDETLAWAAALVSKHRHRVILATHCYMYHDDTRVGPANRQDPAHPHHKNPAWNDGEQIWDKFVRKRKNVVLVVSGHIKGDGTGLLVTKNDAGRPVLQMLANYQHLEHGGKGWLRILRFRPRDGKLDVFTYSPWLDAFNEEPDQRFSLDAPEIFPARVQAERRADHDTK